MPRTRLNLGLGVTGTLPTREPPAQRHGQDTIYFLLMQAAFLHKRGRLTTFRGREKAQPLFAAARNAGAGSPSRIPGRQPAERRLCANGNTVRMGRRLVGVWGQECPHGQMFGETIYGSDIRHTESRADRKREYRNRRPRPRQRHFCDWCKANRLDATSTIAALVCRGTRLFHWKGLGRANGQFHTCTARLFMWRREVGKRVPFSPGPGAAGWASSRPTRPEPGRDPRRMGSGVYIYPRQTARNLRPVKAHGKISSSRFPPFLG